MHLALGTMSFEKLSGIFGSSRWHIIPIHADKMYHFAAGEAQQVKRLKSTRHFPSSSVRHNDAAPSWKLARNDDDWTRTAAKNLRPDSIRRVLCFKMEMRLVAKHYQITTVRLLRMHFVASPTSSNVCAATPAARQRSSNFARKWTTCSCASASRASSSSL